MPIEIFIPVFIIVCIASYIIGYRYEKRRNRYYKDYLERKRNK